MTELDYLVMAKITGKAAAKELPVHIEVTNGFDRGKLGEGRNYGLGFSILSKESVSKYKALMAFTACKDYLNDFVYVESTTNPLGSVYGFMHKYTGILKDKDHFYVGLRPLHYNRTGQYANFDKVKDALRDNKNNIIHFLNKLEKEFKVDKLSEIECYTDDILIIKAPIFWTKFSWLFSLYGLLIRCFLNVTESDLTQDVFKLIAEKKNCLIPEDGSLLKSSQKYFVNFNLDKLLDYKYPVGCNCGYIHNFGIVGRLRELGVSGY